jgi:hypothetical protein
MYPCNPAPRRQSAPISRLGLLLLFCLLWLGLQPALHAQGSEEKPPAPPDFTYEVVDGGPGWSQVHVWEVGVEKTLEEPAADLLMVTPEGIDALPIDQSHKDELYEDFGLTGGGGGIDIVELGGGKGLLGAEGAVADKGTSCPQQAPVGGGGQFIIIDRRFLAHHGPGTLPEEYQAIADAQAGKAIESPMSCNGWDNESKNATWNVSHTGTSASFPLGGGFSGNFAVNFPFQSAGNANIQYRVKSFLCVPYKFQLRNFHATGTLQAAGDAQLEAAASVAYNWSRDWPIADPRIARVTFTVGLIPIRVDFHLPVSVGLALDAEVSATLAQSFDYGVGGSFDYTCTTDSCCGSNDISEHFDTDGSIDASLQARITAEANAKVQVRAEVWSSSIFNAKAGLKGFVQGTVFGYQGSTCGDGDGDGQNENVQGLIAEAKAGVDLIFSVGGALAPDISGSYPGPRWDLGWWDLLDGNSTILSPMVSGPTTAAAGSNVEYRVKMRPCYPYSNPVEIAVGPGSWNGVMTIAEPRGGLPATNSTVVSRSFPNAGQQNLSFTAVRDAAGRELNTTTARTLQVTPPPAVSPTSGAWFNPQRSGNGLDLYVNMHGHYVFIYYTYSGGAPTWYFSDVGPLTNNTFSGALTRYTWDYVNGTRNGEVVGSYNFQFTTPTTGTFNWNIEGATGSEPYQHLHGGSGRTGMYAPGTTPGGLMLNESNGVASATLAYYDGGGNPTWAMGSAATASTMSFALYEYTSTTLCPGCGGTPGNTSTWVGSMTLRPSQVGGSFAGDVTLPAVVINNEPFYLLAY